MSWIAWNKLSRSKKTGGLGFRDIQDYNTTLLAKISCRLLNNPESLLAKVLFGKYGAVENLLSCSAPASASHGWRSILIGRDLLRTQLGWTVGNGQSIKVWEESWIFTSEQKYLIGSPTKASKDWTVDQLLLPSLPSWDHEKLKMFNPVNVEEIKKLKPSRVGAPDKRIWLLEKSGVYSTKTGYHAATNISNPSWSQTLDASRTNWSQEVWNIKTPPKIHHFIWNGSLPTKSTIAARKIQIEVNCIHCKERETIDHILLHCKFAKSVWELAPFERQVDSTEITSFVLGWKYLKGKRCVPPTGLATSPLAAWICWNLWKSGNELTLLKRSFSAKETMAKAIRDAREWETAQIKEKIIRKEQITSSPRPSDQATICRTDAAWKEEKQIAGLGWFFVRSTTRPGSIHSGSVQSVRSVLMAEALAVREALQHAIRLGIENLWIKSDSLQIVKAIKTKISPSEVYDILADVELMSRSFESIGFSFISRDDNSVADKVAKRALELASLDQIVTH